MAHKQNLTGLGQSKSAYINVSSVISGRETDPWGGTKILLDLDSLYSSTFGQRCEMQKIISHQVCVRQHTYVGCTESHFASEEQPAKKNLNRHLTID